MSGLGWQGFRRVLFGLYVVGGAGGWRGDVIPWCDGHDRGGHIDNRTDSDRSREPTCTRHGLSDPGPRRLPWISGDDVGLPVSDSEMYRTRAWTRVTWAWGIWIDGDGDDKTQAQRCGVCVLPWHHGPIASWMRGAGAQFQAHDGTQRPA